MNLFEKFKKDMQEKQIMKQEGSFSLLLIGSIVQACFKKYMKKHYDFELASAVILTENHWGSVFFDYDGYTRCTHETFNKYRNLKSNNILPELEDYESLKSEINQLYREYSPDKIKILSDNQLKDAMNKIVDIADKLLVATIYSEALGDELIKELYMEINMSDSKFEEFINEVSKPIFKSFIIKMDELLTETPKNYYDIQWILCDYHLAPKIEETEKSLNKLIEEKGGIQNIEEEISKKLKEIEKNKLGTQKYKNKLPENLRKLFDFTQLAISIRDLRREFVQKNFTIMSNLGREMFRRKGINEKNAGNFLYYDLISGIYDSKEYKEEIERRKKGLVVYSDGKKVSFEYPKMEEAKKNFYSLLKGQEKLEEIHGKCASKGKVKGKARIILSKKDFPKFKSGEILITSMTRTEFIPLMKKAAAIITDEGGITCHAAIVSRELGKPCVIGTKIATRVLKTGDLVEVNADEGVIKILK